MDEFQKFLIQEHIKEFNELKEFKNQMMGSYLELQELREFKNMTLKQPITHVVEQIAKNTEDELQSTEKSVTVLESYKTINKKDNSLMSIIYTPKQFAN